MRSPNGAQQFFVPDGPTGMLHQTTEGLEFFWSEAYLFPPFLHKAAIGVECDFADYADYIWFSSRGMATPDDRSQPCGKLTDLERLRDIVKCARIQRLDDILFIVTNSEHDNRQTWKGLTHSSTRLFAPHTRHVDIEEDCVIVNHPQLHEGIVPVVRLSDRKP